MRIEASNRRRASLLIGLVWLACASGCGAGNLLGKGAVAPDVVGEGAKGEAVRLSDQRGKLAVVYFYPKNETPGCTAEACAFRDAFDAYGKRGIVIFGISRDDAASHRAFRKAHKLPFVLVADVDGKAQESYGVPSRFWMAARMTFLIDAEGKIARVWRDVDPGVHAREILAAARGLSKSP
jgi:peroxiredoxin Q/BCP